MYSKWPSESVYIVHRLKLRGARFDLFRDAVFFQNTSIVDVKLRGTAKRWLAVCVLLQYRDAVLCVIFNEYPNCSGHKRYTSAEDGDVEPRMVMAGRRVCHGRSFVSPSMRGGFVKLS